MKALNICMLILLLSLTNLLWAKGQEAGNETLEPITNRPTSISMEYCAELMDFDDFVQKYIGEQYNQYMDYVYKISRQFYIERKSASQKTEVCVTDLEIEQIILDLEPTDKKRVAGWKTNFSSVKHRLAIRRSYMEDQSIPVIEKVAAVFKELLHKEFDESSDSYWKIRKNEVTKAIFDSFTTKKPSQEKVLEMILERRMISETEPMWVINGCSDSEDMCPYFLREFISYYKFYFGGAWKIKSFLQPRYGTFTIYSATSCQKSADLCRQAYDILNELWLSIGEKESEFFKEAYEKSGFLITLALASDSDQEKKKYYDLYLWLKSHGDNNQQELYLSENNDFGAEPANIEYSKRLDYRVLVGNDLFMVSAGKAYKNATEILDELLAHSVINVKDVNEFTPGSASFMALNLEEKKQRYLSQKIWSKAVDKLASNSIDRFPRDRSEIRQQKGFESVLFLAFLVEQGEITENLRVPNSDYRIKDIFRKYKQTKKAYDILN